jgi:hypothetical protein
MELDLSAIDWYESRVVQGDYPKTPAKAINVPMWDNADTLKLIEERVALLQSHEHTPDDELPLCTPKERWQDAPTFAVMKKGGKRAIKLYDSGLEAEVHAKSIDGYVEKREAKDKRCVSYCNVCTKCDYWKEKYNK